MLSAPRTTQQLARYFHLPVLSECDAECALCATLGCLRPARITSPELRRELDLAQRNLKTAVVFPPNFLQHAEAASFVTDVISRGLQAIVRLRPEQLTLFRELIATLEYRGATFEVIVSQPIPEKVLKLRAGQTFPAFKTVFVPLADYDPRLLLESVPLSWRRNLEILSALPAVQKSALSPDQMFLFLRSISDSIVVHPYNELDRRPLGLIPGAASAVDSARFSFLALGANDDTIRLSAIFAVSNVDDVAGLERQMSAFKNQTLARQKFEIILVFDRVNDETVERLRVWANESGLTVQAFDLGACWGDLAPRISQAWNLAALYARGPSLVFLNDLTPNAELLAQVSRTLSIEAAVKIAGAGGSPDTPAFGVTLQHYFDLGGFAEALQDSRYAIHFLLWKSARLGVVASEINLQSAGPVTTERRRVPNNPLGAQLFYLCTLSEDVYRSHFALMGAGFSLRRVFAVLGTSSLIQYLKSVWVALRRASHRKQISASFASHAPAKATP